MIMRRDPGTPIAHYRDPYRKVVQGVAEARNPRGPPERGSAQRRVSAEPMAEPLDGLGRTGAEGHI